MISQHNFGVTNVAPNPQNKFNPEQALKTEADNLEFQKQIQLIDDVEKRLLGNRYPKRRKVLGAGGADDLFGLDDDKISKRSKPLPNSNRAAVLPSSKAK
jgi:hypothetical protein